MNDPPGTRKTNVHKDLGDGFRKAWNELLAADDRELDLDRLAAAAEDRLAPEEYSHVLRLICESPLALEILSTLVEEHGVERTARMTQPTDESRVVTSLGEKGGMTRQSHRRLRLPAWAVAACLLIGLGALLFDWVHEERFVSSRQPATKVLEPKARIDELARQLKTAEQQSQEMAKRLLIAEKEQLALLASDYRQPYLSGIMSTELLRIAIHDLGRQRGTKMLSAGNLDSVERAAYRVADSAERVTSASPASQLETAAALIYANRFGDAEEIVNALDQADRLSPDEQAQVMNVRGILLAQRCNTLSPAEARPLWDKAESYFRQAADAGVNEAWLNLAFLFVQERELASARGAVNEYMDNEVDPQRKSIVEKGFVE